MSVHSDTAMSDPVKPREPFTFYIAPSPASLFVPFAGIALILWPLVHLTLLVGPERVVELFSDYPAMWLLVAAVVAGSGVLLRLAFPPRRNLSRLEVRQDRVTFAPRSFDRRMGESVAELVVAADATEILFSMNSLDGLPNGHSLVIRSDQAPDGEIQIKLLRVPHAQYCRLIAEGITSATGLPVRFVARRRSMNGTVLETDWAPCNRSNELPVLAIGAAPFLVGIVAGLLRLRMQSAVALGAACWLAQILVALVLTRRNGRQSEPSRIVLSVLSSVIVFSAAYGLTLAVVGNLVHSW